MIQTYAQAAALLAKRKAQSKPYAKLGNNCYLEPRYNTPGIIAVRYYETDIVTYYPDGKIKLRHGGWFTASTRQNISAFSPFSIYQEKGEWFINTNRDYTKVDKTPKGQLPPGVVHFIDGVILDTPTWALEAV